MRRSQSMLVAIFIGVVIWFGLSRWEAQTKKTLRAQQTADLQGDVPLSVLPASKITLRLPSSPVKKEKNQTPITAQDLEFSLPDPETYREQVQVSEKHEGAGLPPVLREFSQRMATLMEKAAQSPEFASALFSGLQECAEKTENTLIQVRTICAVNALRLGEFHPSEISEKANAFRGSLTPELKQSVEAMGY